ncbi:hypothetical protein [Vibrio parahaemolyticus]|uniref:hypothetical protein n=1 Tax=Vibrio parahaemolyticus TaxID=670 RepID=UPI0011229144|nr:hypothetical protein [Vibrio parahaemolyticus]TOK06033.1 hypothetical protein CGI26_12185 [Vibrio parahaemolyticus]
MKDADINMYNQVVDVRVSNRPIKVAFIIPEQETQIVHWILDGIFCESYSRWGGAFSLLIPINKENIISSDYYKWLVAYDPDYVYSFVDLPETLIEKLHRDVVPIGLICHKIKGKEYNLRTFIPRWPHGIEPTLSISTINSPKSKYRGWTAEAQRNIVVTQYSSTEEDRFLPDNFGVSHSTDIVTYGVEGCFDTLCYCDVDVPQNQTVGTERIHDTTKVLDKISKREAKTFLQLSSIYASGLSHPSIYSWNCAFHIYVGGSVLDRINFWNSRLVSDRAQYFEFSSLSISQCQASNEDFLKTLGEFLNSHNYKNNNSGRNSAHIRSLSESQEFCQDLAEKLQPYTWSNVLVAKNFSEPAIPTEESLRTFYISNNTLVQSFKMRDQMHEFKVDEPSHFEHLPPELLGYRSGQYAVDIKIERPLKNYTVVGGFNDWILPRRIEVTSSLIRQDSKPTSYGSLVTVPNSLINRTGSANQKITISYPSSENVFRHLIVDSPALRLRDARECLNRDNKYQDLALSDKGKKHRGVISLFDDDLEYASILTNKFWRGILRESAQKNSKALTLDRLETKISQFTQEDLDHITLAMRFKNLGETKNYLKNNLRDVVESLVHRNVLIQQYSWRCNYCGNENVLTLDTIKSKNLCGVCDRVHFTPIDMTWEYKFSSFIISSLCEHNGLSVLWASHHLLGGFNYPHSIYLPEVDLYINSDNSEKNEIDLLALIKGLFCAVEVKLSAASFVESESEVNAFIDEATRLEADEMYLVFEQYCQETEEIDTFKDKLNSTIEKIREKIPEFTTLKVIVASDIANFNKLPIEIGPYGYRTYSYLDRMDRSLTRG